MFEWFILCYGTKRDSKYVQAAIRGKLNHYYTSSLILKYGPPFWYFAALSMYRVNSRCAMPLVHFTIQQEYRGLSRIGRTLTAAYGGAPNIRNYDKKKQKLIDSYSLRVENMVTENNGIIAYDNWCHVYGSPHLSTERDTAYVKSNFTVVGVSRYVFKVRPKFAWRWVDEKVVQDIKPYENKVTCFF